MADKQNNSYLPPTSPPPNYAQPKPQEHHDAGPYYPPGPNPSASPAPGPYNQMNTFNPHNGDMRAPEQAYGGYYNPNQQGPPQQGYYGGQPQGGYYGGPPGPQQGYYGQPGPQGMYYQQQPVQGYYADRPGGSGSGGGICAGILGALACCCCLDMMF